jgi:integrase
MSLKKRGTYYYWHEWIDGLEYRESLKTTDRNEAKRRRQERITEIKNGQAGKLSRQHFELAVDAYLESRHLYVEPRTYTFDKERSEPLKKFFGKVPLRKITADMVTRYQIARKEAGLSNATINKDIGLLRRVLKKHKLWTRISDNVKMLPELTEVGRALELEEQKNLLEMAATKKRWMIAYCAAVLALNTTMRSAEIKNLQWGRVDLFEKTLTVSRKTTKTDAGERIIPLNRDAIWALSQMWARAVEHGKEGGREVQPEDYVFCACENYKYNPTEPMMSWRSAWRNLTRAVSCPTCGTIQQPQATCKNERCHADIKDLRSSLQGLRFHDLRHSAITALAESGQADHIIMSIAGHVSQKMLEHYSHIRLQAKRSAVETLESRTPLALEQTQEASVTQLN